MDGRLQRESSVADECRHAATDAQKSPLSVRSMEQALIEALDLGDAADAGTRTQCETASAPGVSARQGEAPPAPTVDRTLAESAEFVRVEPRCDARGSEDWTSDASSTESGECEAHDVEGPTLRERGVMRYQLAKRIGRGGMAEVFEARELATGRRCAVKLIRPDSADRPRTRARFRREAELMMRVQHPNVARCMGLREADDGTLYMVQEYIEGGSLKSLIRSSQEVGPRTAVSIILQLLRALDAVHAAGLVHRDVKPSNIMLTRDEDGRDVVKLIDFGLSEVVKGPATRTPAPVGRTLGTPAYVAPEQAMGLDADPRSDVYSASAVLYEMFTGVRVFRARTVNHLVLMHLHDKPVPVRERAPWLSKDLGFAVMKGLRKRQETRFSTARDFARDLARAMRPRSTASPALRST